METEYFDVFQCWLVLFNYSSTSTPVMLNKVSMRADANIIKVTKKLTLRWIQNIENVLSMTIFDPTKLMLDRVSTRADVN